MLLSDPVIRQDGALEVRPESPPGPTLRLPPVELVVLRALLGAGGAARTREIYATLFGAPRGPVSTGRSAVLGRALTRLRARGLLLASPPGTPVAVLSDWGLDLAAWLLRGWDGWDAYGHAIARAERMSERLGRPALGVIRAALADGSWRDPARPLPPPPNAYG